MRYDAIVVGGGPAGSTCAWRLHRAGLRVAVVDRSQFPRDKVCAGWITPQVVRTLELSRRTLRVVRLNLAWAALYNALCVPLAMLGWLPAWLAGLVGPQTRVAVLQNGVEHVERFTPWLPADRITPAVVDIPAERTAQPALVGEITGRAAETIVLLDGAAGVADLIEIDCAKLSRVDFAAAGVLLNWLLATQAHGKQFVFTDVNVLVATLFGVMGIDGIARVQRRKT